jgi:hypothetical protein
MLFLPWNDEKDLITGFSTYEAKFDSIKNSLEFDSLSYNLFVKNKLELEKTIEYSKQFKDIESNNSSNDSEDRSETESTTTNEELNNVFIEIPKVSIPNNIDSMINELNEEQLNLFNDIMKKLQNNNQHEQINFFCSGVAGLYELIFILTFIELNFFINQ